ncbi:short-chain dehydrogenase/reductase family protein [Rhexocercosporidium sp. MPI-PUGE-AT-0058]|nr:short-chain dehydrogenase/reductase family protein [Rhexocercosporidium sp. MPI-PUGE-AT-0058]
MPYFQPKLTLPPNLSFANKTILITGPSAGLGLAATTLVLQHSASEIIFGVRNTTKGNTTRSQILSSPLIKNIKSTPKISVLELNLESYDSVLKFAKEVKEKWDGKLDMLLLNAGTGSLKRETVGGGHEKTIQVNLLSSALLAVELLPTLEKTARRTGVPSRITWVGSFVQFDHSLGKHPIPGQYLDTTATTSTTERSDSILSYFDDEKSFVSMARYSDSKLLVTIFVDQLAKFVKPELVVVNDVSPGMVSTGFGEYPVWLRGMMAVFFGLKARSPEEGAKTYLHALGVVGRESHGMYLSDNRITERAPITKTPVGKQIQEKLWDNMWKEFLKLDAKLEPLTRQVL